MITTKKNRLTRNDFLKILLKVYFKKRWWLLGLMLLIALISVFGNYTSGTFLIAMPVLYPAFVVIQLWRFTKSPENAIFYREKYYEIDAGGITAYVDRGSQSIIKMDAIIKVDNVGNYYLLYISKNSFIPVAADSFRTGSDKAWFYREFYSRFK